MNGAALRRAMAADELVAQVRHAVAMPGVRSRVVGRQPFTRGMRVDEDETHWILCGIELNFPDLIAEMLGERRPDLIPKGVQIRWRVGSQRQLVRPDIRELERLSKRPPCTQVRVEAD